MSAGEVQEGIDGGVGQEVNVASLSAVSAVGPAARDEAFPPEADAAVAALAAADEYLSKIDEHHVTSQAG
jgi:hypothetical protein